MSSPRRMSAASLWTYKIAVIRRCGGVVVQIELIKELDYPRRIGAGVDGVLKSLASQSCSLFAKRGTKLEGQSCSSLRLGWQ